MGLSIHITKHLKGFSLQVDLETESLITGLLGASGCGKSMTLRCIAGIERPDEGEIILNGKTLFDSKKHIHLPPQEREVGYLFQNYALFPNMSVEQNILAGLCREKDRLKKKETVELLLQDFSLLPHRRKKPQELSGGQAQRTALARILASKPQLLLLDEPFSALDSYLRDQLQVQMRETLHHFQKDTILVTHNRDEAYHMCERLALMDNGHIFSHGNVKSVFSCPKTVAGARITGCKNIAFAQKTGSHSLQIPEWKLALTLPYEIPEALCAVGIRAHAFSIQPTAGPSCHPISVHFCGEMEEPFEWILQFRIQGQDKDTPPIWWRFAKETYPKELPKTLYFQSSDLLLLQA